MASIKFNFSCSWPGKGAPASWEQFLNCRLVRLLWLVQGVLWKLPCVKVISVILQKAEFEERVLLTASQPGPSDRPMQWVQHRWQCGSSVGIPPKGKKPPVLASSSVPWNHQWCSVPLGTGFVIWLLDLWELMFSHQCHFHQTTNFGAHSPPLPDKTMWKRTVAFSILHVLLSEAVRSPPPLP